MQNDDVMSRADIVKELSGYIKTFGFCAVSRLKKNEALRRLQAMRKFKEIHDAEPDVPKVKPGPLGTRSIPVQTVVIQGDTIAAPVVPVKRTTYDRQKPRRCIADIVENHGVVSFKD